MKVRINTHGNPLPESHGEWVDLRAAEDVEMKAGEYRLISLGVSMELPEGYYAEVAPRSSTFGKYGILMANGIGIIDHDYASDEDIWRFPAYATHTTEIPKGARICQFKLVKKSPDIEFVGCSSLGNPSRGGFGSTGV